MTKTTKLIIIGLIAMFLVWGHYAKQQAIADSRPLFNRGVETNLVKIMENTCEESHKVISGELENECDRLINSLECRGFEVLNKGGDFWAKPNKGMRC